MSTQPDGPADQAGPGKETALLEREQAVAELELELAWAALSKLRVRLERSIQAHLALLSLACSVICIRSLPYF